MKKKREKEKPFLDTSLLTLLVTTAIILLFAVTMKYPSLVLYQEVEVSDTTEVGYSENLLPPPMTVRFWCETDLEWATLVEGRPVAFINEGILPEGRYEGYCHAVSQPDAAIQIYFNQRGAGFLIKRSDEGFTEIPFST